MEEAEIKLPPGYMEVFFNFKTVQNKFFLELYIRLKIKRSN